MFSLERSWENAKKFYTYDRELSPSDRAELASYFKDRMTKAPLVGIPVAVAFALLPVRHRVTRIVLTCIGSGLGQNIGCYLVSAAHLQQMEGHDAKLGAYNEMSKYPSFLGKRYFEQSAADPSSIMSDPSMSRRPFLLSLMRPPSNSCRTGTNPGSCCTKEVCTTEVSTKDVSKPLAETPVLETSIETTSHESPRLESENTETLSACCSGYPILTDSSIATLDVVPEVQEPKKKSWPSSWFWTD